MKIAIAGAGYVGLSNAILLAQHHEVTAVDIIEEKVEMINQRRSPLVDREIEDYLANAKLDLTVVQTMDKKTKVFSDIGGILKKNASVELVKMELGGKEVYSGAYMDLKEDSSSFKAHIGYLGEEKQRLDMNYVARHHGRKTESLMESSGVLSGEAFKLFRGTIDFVKGCPGSVGNEKEDVLLLGDDVVNQTIPLILCAEEDVEGNHGASIGELDEKTLFYLMSRGFTKEAAEKMIARARLDAVAGQIKEPCIREKTLK